MIIWNVHIVLAIKERKHDQAKNLLCVQAVCVEAGMIALRREAEIVTHEDFMDAVMEVQAKKKQNLNYYA